MNINDATPAQRAAITTDAEDVLAIAGPGSGKTATLVARIGRLLAEGIPAGELVVLTFTNAGANELADRIARNHASNAQAAPDLGFLGTLHSFALRMLKEHGAAHGYGDRVAIVSPESAADLLASKAKSLGCKIPIKGLLALKANGRPKSETFSLPETVVASYLDDMRTAGIVDYDGLLMEFERLLADEGFAGDIAKRFAFLFVDEVQDSAPIDWRIYRAIPARSKFYVGDPDQAIFGFRGGRVDEMISHSSEPGVEVVKLEANFRSHSEICAAAQRLIEHNRTRLPKVTTSVKGPGGLIIAVGEASNEGEEVSRVGERIKDVTKTLDSPTIAVIARTNAIAALFRKGLPSLGVRVVEVTRAALPADWAYARALLELFLDPENDALAFFYVVAENERKGKTPKHARELAHAMRRQAAANGVSMNGAELGFSPITNPANALAALSLHDVTREARAIIAEKFRELPPGSTTLDLALSVAEVREYVKEQEGEGVRVMTIHGSKGREFDVVFLVGFEDEAIPGRAGRGPAEDVEARDALIEEERRLAYVALTRARRAVFITHAQTRLSQWSGVEKRNPSRFLPELL